jgi:hypothetical protein
MDSCIDYALVDIDRNYVIIEASVCSDTEFEIVRHLVDMVNKKFNMNVKDLLVFLDL